MRVHRVLLCEWYVQGSFCNVSYGIQYIEDIGITENPCKGIELHSEKAKERYVTDEDYNLQLEFTKRHGADYLPVFFEHAYLLVSRSVEVSDLKISSVTDEGYIVKRRKGSKSNIILWSSRLKAAHDNAMRLHRKRGVRSIYFIPNTKGMKLNPSILKSAMERVRKLMVAAGLGDVYWTLHDLKRKAFQIQIMTVPQAIKRKKCETDTKLSLINLTLHGKKGFLIMGKKLA